MMLVKGDWRMG